MRLSAVHALLIVLITGASFAHALDYVSVAEGPAILYDAPSTKAKKLFVVSRYLPLEQVVSLNTWVKVRDSTGSLAWVEKSALSSKRFVVVTAATAEVRLEPEESAPVVFLARQQVAMEWLENDGSGWVKVLHQNGVTGYIKKTDVWGD